MALFIDLEALSARQTDLALGLIYKAIHSHDDDSEIWDEHPSPMIRKLVELFTSRGLTRIEKVRTELVAWLNGERSSPTMPLRRPEGMMGRWTTAERDLVRLYLEALPADQWTIEDHMMVIDYLVQRYLPPDVLKTEAEWLATRAAMMGKVQAAIGELPEKQAERIMAEMPNSARAAVDRFGLTGAQRAVVEFGANRAAEHVVSLEDGLRHRMRTLIARNLEQAQLAGAQGRLPAGPSLQTQLLDEFGTANKDWRRIAITEATEALGQGFVAATRPGSKLRRSEQYRNACSWCRKIDGRVFEVVDPADPDKDWDTQIWVGKTNVGRSSAPRKRVGDKLVEREPHELWSVAAGSQHPHCRGRWLPTIEAPPGDDTSFGDWLRATLAKPTNDPDKGT